MDDKQLSLMKYGLYGKKACSFNLHDIELYFNKDYAEFIYTKDLEEIKRNLNFTEYEKLNDLKEIKSNIECITLRCNFSIFKSYLTRYKIKEDYPYKVIDFLLTVDKEITTEDIKISLNLDPKRIFYILKKLKNQKVIKYKTFKTKVYYTLIKDSLFYEVKDIVNETPPLHPKVLLLDVPILHQIRNAIQNSQIGVTTENIQKMFGFPVKEAFYFLNRIVSLEKDKYKSKKIFFGKIKRLLFYVGDKKLTVTEKESSDYVTIDSRIEALNKMLKDKEAFVVTEDTLREFQLLMNSRYQPCRKTIMSTAIKAGHKIFIVKEKNDNKTIIAKENISIIRYLNKNWIPECKFNNKIEESFYNNFVYNPLFIAQDNSYQIKESERAKLIFNWLLNVSKETINTMNKESTIIKLNKELINCMNLELIFQIIPVEIMNFKKIILENPKVRKGSTLKEITYEELYKQKLFGIHSKSIKIKLHYKVIERRILK